MQNTNDILEALKLRADMLDQAEQENELEPSEKESLFFIRVIAHIRGLMQRAEIDQDFIRQHQLQARQYKQQIGAMKAEKDKLIQAVADHVTQRAEQRQRIQKLEPVLEFQNRELVEKQKYILHLERKLSEAKNDATKWREFEAEVKLLTDPRFVRIGFDCLQQDGNLYRYWKVILKSDVEALGYGIWKEMHQAITDAARTQP